MNAPLEALKEIERLISDEVNQRGDVDDRFKALLQARRIARKAIQQSEQQSS